MRNAIVDSWMKWIIVAVLCAASPIARAADPQQIDLAIRHGVDYLYSTQKSGVWDSPAPTNEGVTELHGGQWGGETAVCTYALLSAGEKYEDPKLKPAIQFLLKSDITGIYSVGIRAQVLNLLPKGAEVKQVMQRDMQLLENSMRTDGPAKGFYDYVQQTRNANRYDHSVSQIAVLGAWACAENFESFNPEYWKTADTAWRADQYPNGAWSYYKLPQQRYPATIAMAAAGVATLFITQDFINRGRSSDAVGNPHDANIEKGIKWIGDNYNTLLNGDHTAQYYPFYGLYGIERVGVASGYKYFGNVNWYEDGADYLLKTQNRNGGWAGTINTALALLFLTRGRAPVVMNKLEYSLNNGSPNTEANWNQRPRDAANLAKFIGRQAERLLNWQIVDFKASADEMLDAPILYIGGNQVVSFTPAQKQTLKQFVERGGLILAHADTSSTAFSQSIRRLGTELFKYEFRALPVGHVIYTSEQFPSAKWRRKPNVLGLSNGVRELILLLPDGDPARFWQSYEIGTHSEIFELAANIFQYSVDKENLRNKGETYLVKLDTNLAPQKSVKIVRVRYDGNWDPEPAGWVRLAGLCNNIQRVGLTTQIVDVKDLATSNAKVAHLTGTGPIRFNEASRNAIKTFVTNGGVLVVDSAGGSPQFSQSIEGEFDAIFGDVAAPLKETLPADHPLYKIGGKLDIEYRAYARRNLTGDLKLGRLRAMSLNGKPAIIYSPEDLSEGLVGQPVDGVLGYAPQTAWRLMANIIQYATSDSR